MRRRKASDRSWWPADWLEEYRAMMTEVIREATDSSERINLFLAKLNDAVQAHREWALILEAHIRRRGAGAEVSKFAKQQAPKVPFGYNGELLMMPSVVGLTRTTDDGGEKWIEQALLTFAPWAELRTRRSEDLVLRKAYDAKVALLDMLLALEEMAPNAESPFDAAQELGISLDDYLAGGAAA